MSDNLTLPIKLVVNVDVDYQHQLLGRDNFRRLLIIGSSPNARETLTGIYSTPEAVKADYGVEANEYKIAKKYFSQVPRPRDVMIATVGGSAKAPSYINISEAMGEGVPIGSVIGEGVPIDGGWE